MNKTLKNFGRFFVFALVIIIFSLAVFTLPTHQVFAEGSFVFTGHLELGVVSNDVKELQTLLNSKGYNVGTPDGKFGPTTKEQVILFQKANGLTPDGIIGQRSRAFLNGTSTISPISSASRTLKLTIPRIKGDDVKALQTFLNNSGYNCGTADGIFGPKTEAQVKLFQNANKLTPDGKVGKITRNLINITSVSSTQGTLFISGCSGKIGYSTITGVSCSTVFLPIGCNSSSIYSTSTGLSCATGLLPAFAFKIVQFVNNIKRNTIINIPTITGVTIPAQGETPVGTSASTSEYTATISWTGSPSVFLASTSYTATITLTPKSSYTLTGVRANFFTVAGATATNSLDGGIITAVFPSTPLKQLTISDPTITTSKAYNGNTTAVVTTGTLAGVTSGETVTVTATATYDNKNFGTGKSITVIYTLGGADAGHYIKPADYTISTGVITIILLTIANPTLTTSKQYDRTTTAIVTASSLIGKVSGDDVTVTALANYDIFNIGTNKTITVVYTLAGADAGNYTKPVNYTTSSGVITAVQFTISTPTLTTTKVYNATTTATVTAGSLVGILAGDTVTVSAVANYDTALVGTGKTITTVYTLGGGQAENYIKPINNINNTGVITAIVINTAAIAGVTAPVAGATPVGTLADGTGYTATISWSPSGGTFGGGTVYTATITLTPMTGYTLTGVTENFFTVAGATTTNPINSGVVTAVFPVTQEYATTPSSITLAVGSTAPVGGVTNVAIPSAGGTDVTGVITGYVATSADKIKFTVVEGGSATSAITINGGVYTSGADYKIIPTTTLPTVIVTTSEAGKITGIRTFVITGPILGTDGLTYGIVMGADGKKWLDRNLGATRIATSFNDYQSYGNLYQWGRGADGHQLITHTTTTAATPVNGSTTTLSVSDTPGNNLFIKQSASPYDWRSTKNDNLWQGVNGVNNVCPAGFRLPTNTEQQTLVTVAGITNSATAYSSSLKFTVAGHRSNADASLNSLGFYGYYWSSSVSGTRSLYLNFSASSVNPAIVRDRAIGFTVRCLKD